MILIKQKRDLSGGRGQTLLEILLAFSASILVLSAIVVGITASLSNALYAKNQNLANSYAQEGMAVVRQIRDSSWNDFLDLDDYTDENTIYCLDEELELNQLILPAQNCWAQRPVGKIFSRQVVFYHNSLDCSRGSRAVVTVAWSDSKCPVGTPFCHNTELITCFSNID